MITCKSSGLSNAKIDLFYTLNHFQPQTGMWFRSLAPGIHHPCEEDIEALKQRQFKQVDGKKLFRWVCMLAHIAFCMLTTLFLRCCCVSIRQITYRQTQTYFSAWFSVESLDEQSFVYIHTQTHTPALKHKHILSQSFFYFLKRKMRKFAFFSAVSFINHMTG